MNLVYPPPSRFSFGESNHWASLHFVGTPFFFVIGFFGIVIPKTTYCLLLITKLSSPFIKGDWRDL